MQEAPAALSDDKIGRAVSDHWGWQPQFIKYLKVGAGAHHWRVTDSASAPFFVTVDDFGSFVNLRNQSLVNALEVADGLAHAGLQFVAPPIRSRTGQLCHTFSDRFAISLYDHIDGVAGDFADIPDPATTTHIVEALHRLHQTPAADLPAEHANLALPVNSLFLDTMEGQTRTAPPGVPEPLAEAVLSHRSVIRSFVHQFNSLAAKATARLPLVLTHGEPHLGNVLRRDDSVTLVDWETVRLSLPERDLWLVARKNPSAVDTYEALAGRRPDHEMLRMFEIRWWLTDLVLFTEDLSDGRHSEADAENIWALLKTIITNPPVESQLYL